MEGFCTLSTFNKYRTKGAYHYEWYETEPWYKWCIDRCVKFCKGSTIDIGCGEGLLVQKIEENGFEATGIEPDHDARRLADPDLDIRDGSVYDAFLGEWEYLACLNVIEHLEHPERLKDLIRNNITKGAIIITIDWQGGAFGYDHTHEYTERELVDFFKEFHPKPFRYKNTEWIGVEIKK